MAHAITITGIKELRKKLDSASKQDLNAALRRTVDNAAIYVQYVMRGFTPVDTGKLRDSIKITQGGGGFNAFVGPDLAKAHYAPYVEYGFHHWRSGKFIPGQKYVEKTLFFVQKDIGVMFGRIISDFMKEF